MLKGELIETLYEEMIKVFQEEYSDLRIMSICKGVALGNNACGWSIIDYEKGKEWRLSKDEALSAYLNFQRGVVEGLDVDIEEEIKR